MLIGAMNHPAKDLAEEIKWMSGLGFDFIDLTLEPPSAPVWAVDAKDIRKRLHDSNLKVVGHTAYYLPIASPFETLRRAAIDELKRCLEVFSIVGAQWMNVHPDAYAPLHPRSFSVGRNLESLRELLAAGKQAGVGIMAENLPGSYNTAAQLKEILDPIPELAFHMDIGHCNLMVQTNTVDELLEHFGSRLRHVHLHDNKGGTADLHLPLGAGTLDVIGTVQSLKRIGYDATVTLEVFTPEDFYLACSRSMLREMWDDPDAAERFRRRPA